MDYIIHIVILISIFSTLSISLNLVVGYTGLLSVTQAAFYGVGAYVVGLGLTALNLNFFVAMILGVIVTAIVAFLMGIVLSKFRDDYYALATFGFNIILYSVMLNWQEVTRGPLGVPGIAKPELFGIDFGNNGVFLLLTLIIAGLVYWIAQGIARSSFGRVLRAIREDEQAIQVFGYRTVSYKLLIFVISAGLAALGGALFASYITFIDPSSFILMESVFILAMVILGGLADNQGAIIGALIMVLLPELPRFVGFPTEIAGQMRQLVYGLLLVVLMLYRPQGILGKFKL